MCQPHAFMQACASSCACTMQTKWEPIHKKTASYRYWRSETPQGTFKASGVLEAK